MIVTFVAAVAIAALITTAGDPHIVTVTTLTSAAALGFPIHLLWLAIGNRKLIIKYNLNIIRGYFVFPVFPLGACCGDGVIPLPMRAC